MNAPESIIQSLTLNGPLRSRIELTEIIERRNGQASEG